MRPVSTLNIMINSRYKVIPGRIAVALTLALCALIHPSSFVNAQEDAGVGDWVTQCDESGEFAGRCFIRQSLTLKDTGRMLFDIAAGYPMGGEYPLLLLSAPLGMYLPGGIILEVDGTGSYRATVAYCNTDGCHAYYRMTPELYRLFRQGRWLNIAFLDGTRRANRFQVSLNGFSDGIDSVRQGASR